MCFGCNLIILQQELGNKLKSSIMNLFPTMRCKQNKCKNIHQSIFSKIMSIEPLTFHQIIMLFKVSLAFIFNVELALNEETLKSSLTVKKMT